MSEQPIACAAVTWNELGQPISSQFDDVYFSKDNGLAETDYVFLQANHLSERFGQLPDHSNFVIGETGFGSGLNFLAAWRLWQQTAPATATLHFVSVEAFPLSFDDLQQALALWPELETLAEQLLAQYPAVLSPGFHRLVFGRVHLTLIFADATDGLTQLRESLHPSHTGAFGQRSIDAWFLDGFAPAKNPQMWQPELFQTLAQLSSPSSTLATFTAAGVVKRGLSDAGFNIKKIPGYGRKREMLVAMGPQTPKQAANYWTKTIPAASHGWMVNPNIKAEPGATVAVIGAGLAGAHTANALAKRGLKVRVFDRHEQPASEASGNPQGIVYAKLSAKSGALSDFNLQALLFALRHYHALAKAHPGIGDFCGVLQLAQSDQQWQQQLALIERLGNQSLVRAVEAPQASELAGCSLSRPGLYFPQAGWLRPRAICQALINHPNIQFQGNTSVSRLQPLDQQWQLYSNNDHCLGTFDQVVIASANNCVDFSQTEHLPVKPVRGQITQTAVHHASQSLRTVVCSDGYIAPADAGRHCLGASFNLNNQDLTLTTSDHQDNLKLIEQIAPELTPPWQANIGELNGRAALRCTTPDYLPLVGPVADVDRIQQDFEPLRRNARYRIDATGTFVQGLYSNLGHGSRGLTYIPIAAELLAAHMLGEPNPLGHDMSTALHPARFIIRDLRRNRR